MSCNSTKEIVKFTPLSVLPYAHALPRRNRGQEADIVQESGEEKECNSTNNFTRVNPKVSISQFFEHGLIDVISFDALANNMLSVESEKDQKNCKFCSLANTSSVKEKKNDYSSRAFRNVAIVNSDNDDNDIGNNNEYNNNTVKSNNFIEKGSSAFDSNEIDDEKRYAIVSFTDNYDQYEVHTYDDYHSNNDNSYDNSRSSSFAEKYLSHIKNESSHDTNEQQLSEREEGRVSWEKDGNYSSSKSSTANRNSRNNKSLLKFWDWCNADSCSFDKVTHNITANTSLTNAVNVPATLDATLSMITTLNVFRARTASTFTISSTSSAAKRDSDSW